MSRTYSIPVWKSAPFIRLLIPFMAGIILQWYLKIPLPAIIVAAVCFTISFILFSFLPLALKFKWKALQGFLLTIIITSFGALACWQNDIRQQFKWYGNIYKDSDKLVLRINEPLVEKPKSFKAECLVESILRGDSMIHCKGKLLVYFSRDSIAHGLQYGDRIIISKSPQTIKNSGNPGAFDYKQYATFRQIFQQVFIKEKDWIKLEGSNANKFRQFIFKTRESIVTILRDKISGKNESAIAEALLIGYTNDLDKDLVQAYSNTGVVHIIAISGMHLALIYLVLIWIFARLPFIKKSKIIQAFLVLLCLWLFSLLTGAAASVLRAAVMFTFICIGNNFFRKSSIYNSLAASAFILLCYDPYFLWDVGFQLSYLAVISIIVFQKFIYDLIYIKNKWINNLWQLVSVTLAAQILTFPVCIYYFHQFPLLFLFANIVAVPLSGFILYAEILLTAVAWIPFVGSWIGKITGWMLWLMNTIITCINQLSFAVWDNISATLFSTIVLYAAVISFGAWMINKQRSILKGAFFCSLIFTMLHAYYKWQNIQQQKIIVYNVPQHKAIDLVKGNDYYFAGDSILIKEGLLQNFHLKPGRIAMQLNKQRDSLPGLFSHPPFYQFNNTRILLINQPMAFEFTQKVEIDMIIISGNPKLYIPQLAKVFNCRQYIFDASNSLWKIGKWQKDCEALHLGCHSVAVDGAFVFDL